MSRKLVHWFHVFTLKRYEVLWDLMSIYFIKKKKKTKGIITILEKKKFNDKKK